MGTDVAGVPADPVEDRREAQHRQLPAVIVDAIRLVPVPSGGAPVGMGQGEGPAPRAVAGVAEALLELQSVLAPGTPVLDWLTSALEGGSGRDADLTLAAMAVRDLLVAAIDPGPDVEAPDGEPEARDEREAAQVVATGTIEVA